MTFVNLPSRKIKVSIQHERLPHYVGTMKVKGSTTARIYDENEKQLAVGIAYCGPNDQFVRHEGVKNSLRRALAGVEGLKKAERTLIWAKVLNRHVPQPVIA